MISMIINDASREEAELIADEQHAQESYASFTRDCTDTINADNSAILKKKQLLEESIAEKGQTQAALLTNGEALTSLSKALDSMHLDCDFLLKYYDTRKTARSEEIGAIVEAKAILSGADFGKAMEAGENAEAS